MNMKHKMKLLEKPFNDILDGTKEIEFRLYDDKRKQINIGDTIEFCKLPQLEEKIIVEVKDLFQYPTFKELLLFLGYSNIDLERQLQEIYSIYTKEQEKEFGVLGIKIEIVK